MSFGLRTWNASGQLQMDTSTFTYQVVSNTVINFAATSVANIPIAGNASNHCAVILNLDGSASLDFMPHIVVQQDNVQITRYHPANSGGRFSDITARVLIMRYAV